MLWERMVPPLEQLSLPQLSVFSPNRAKRHFLDRLYISWTHSGGLKRFAPKFLLCSEISPPRVRQPKLNMPPTLLARADEVIE
jgi:hypothetical protein